MALNPLGVLDLSVVTDLLIQTITNAWDDSPLWTVEGEGAKFMPTISGLTPDAVRQAGGCTITVSLIHVEPNKSQRNFVYPPASAAAANPVSPRAQMIPALPLGLDLLYFVTAFSDNAPSLEINRVQEQQAMSIVLRCFHENPIIRTNVTFSGSPSESTQEEFTLTMEIESADSMSRFWQAITVPFRFSLMYRVAVVFLTPPAPPTTAKQVVNYSLALAPSTFPFAQNGQVFGTSSTSAFAPPIVAPDEPAIVTVDYSPALVVPGQRFFVNGAGLNQGTDYSGASPNPGTSYRVYLLLPPDYKTEVEVTSQWKALDTSPPGAIQTPARLVIDLPDTIGALPSNAPPAGVYSIRAGSDASSDAITNRTNSTSFRVAARIDIPGSPPQPVLTDVAGTYTVTGLGFVPGSTQVLLETVPLAYVTTPPVVGEFTVADAGTLTFQAPSGLKPGMYGVRVLVNEVESPPAVWIKI
jgi:hypothetical protein